MGEGIHRNLPTCVLVAVLVLSVVVHVVHLCVLLLSIFFCGVKVVLPALW